MKIHEYQAKELLREYGAPVPGGYMVTTPEGAKEAAEHYETCVLKAQVHSGGRGKAGGVKLVHSPAEAFSCAENLLGKRIYPHQAGPDGKLVSKLLVTEAVDVQKEFYLAVTGDMENAGLVIVSSAEGGVEIEETAKTRPEAILTIPVSPMTGYRTYEGLPVAASFGLDAAQTKELHALLRSMVRLYLEKDCSLVEINPLVLTKEGKLLCLDAKVNFDDNALYLHPEIADLKDPAEEDPMELRAQAQGLSYVHLSGNIGCLVNGAGLAMATMDILSAYGGSPANFLDVGGSATAQKVKAAFEIVLSDPGVKAIFVNIFGGIMKCDIIAEGVVEAARELGISVPLIVRLEGTNADKGKEILRASGLSIIAAGSMAEGAKLAIGAAK